MDDELHTGTGVYLSELRQDVKPNLLHGYFLLQYR